MCAGAILLFASDAREKSSCGYLRTADTSRSASIFAAVASNRCSNLMDSPLSTRNVSIYAAA